MKNILITGANSGVGLAATKFFASKGHNLICKTNVGNCKI